MSRVGKLPVTVPAKVEVTLAATEITVKGPLGTLKQAASSLVNVKKDGDKLVIEAANDSQAANAMSGTMRALLANMVKGVEKGFERKLNLVGVGYKAAVQGNKLNLALGYSHPVVHDLPEGVKAVTPTPTEIILTGVDKQKVGQVAAVVRSYRPPEPYKGKGVRYAEEVIVLKETKKK
ncbi:MAG: 50S ribosomal protein L6 [Burkholderiales bacterium]|jgi:large subunit ribosomal protein L6|nr:50S ribosomal protein L6 [Nitrosomonadaceae bacterium]